MSRDKPWLKMWAEWLGDAKMDRLSLAEQGAWWRLVSLAHECGDLDENGKPTGALIVAGTPLSLTEIMKSLKITGASDQAILSQMLDKMKAVGSLYWNSNTLVVTHYEERQRAVTDTKEDRARRQRERREALKEKEKREAEKRTPPLLEEESKRKEAEAETHAQTSNVKAVTLELSRCYERYIGLLNPLDADRMIEFTQYYESHDGKIAWIEQAFIKTPVNKRRWPYVQAILERYIEEGGTDGRAAQGRGVGEPNGAHRRDPLAGARATGWEVIGDDEEEPSKEGDQG